MNDDRKPTADDLPTSEMGAETSQRGQVVVSCLHDILASERRRNILSFLKGNPGKISSREELVEILLDCEPDEPGPVSHRECLEIELHHVHLPKLADTALIDYDPTSGTVEYRASADIELFVSQYAAIDQGEL